MDEIECCLVIRRMFGHRENAMCPAQLIKQPKLSVLTKKLHILLSNDDSFYRDHCYDVS